MDLFKGKISLATTIILSRWKQHGFSSPPPKKQKKKRGREKERKIDRLANLD